MKKRYVILGIIILLICTPFIWGTCSNLAYTAENSAKTMSYSAAINNGKPTVILFYANWCSYCRKFMPIFNSLSAKNSDDFNFVKINIDSERNKYIAKEYDISSLPTVYIFEKKYKIKKEVSPYSYGNVKSMQSELDYYLNHRR